MLEFDTPFRAKVRALQAPNSLKFDPAAWSTLLKAGDPSSSDLALAATAVWVGKSTPSGFVVSMPTEEE